MQGRHGHIVGPAWGAWQLEAPWQEAKDPPFSGQQDLGPSSSINRISAKLPIPISGFSSKQPQLMAHPLPVKGAEAMASLFSCFFQLLASSGPCLWLLRNAFQVVTSSLVQAQVAPDPHCCRRLTALGPPQTCCKSLCYLVLTENPQGCPRGSCHVPSCSCQHYWTPASHASSSGGAATLASWWAKYPFIPRFGTKEKCPPAFLLDGNYQKGCCELWH